MNLHIHFTDWALAQGLKLDGIAAHKFPGRRYGLIATKTFKVGDTLLTVPASAIRTAQTVSKAISTPIGTIAVQGLLAAELSLDTSAISNQWRHVLPTKEEFQESMPLMWPRELRELLPSAASSLVKSQEQKILVDWKAVSTAFPKLSYDKYLCSWFTVSTRTFYFTSETSGHEPSLTHEDCLALVPFADYFNHADVGCKTNHTPSEYTFCADKQIEKGDEIYISYGNHSNDFLLAEYGFILEENKWDQIKLDEIILPMFNKEDKELLQMAGLLGNYVLDQNTVSYRTEAALRVVSIPSETSQNSSASGTGPKDRYRAPINNFLSRTYRAYLNVVDEKLRLLSVLDSGTSQQRATLKRRWEQIHVLLCNAFSRIKT